MPEPDDNIMRCHEGETSPQPDELEKARLLLEQADAERQRQCADEVQAVLERHGFTLRVESSIVLVPVNRG